VCKQVTVVSIVAIEQQQSGSTAIHVAVNNINRLVLRCKSNNGFALRCCSATNCFLRLSVLNAVHSVNTRWFKYDRDKL
jgi:hypothetical protein